MRSVRKTRVKFFRPSFSTGGCSRQSRVFRLDQPVGIFSRKKLSRKKPFFDCVRKLDLGFSRKRPFSPDKSDCIRNGTTNTKTSGIVTKNELLLLLQYALCTWYEVRPCVFDCCIGRETVDVARSRAVHQPHTYAVTSGSKAELETRLLQLYCCRCAAPLYQFL